jgi:hypothetical protein
MMSGRDSSEAAALLPTSIVHTPLVALQPASVPGMLKSMVSASEEVFASCMAALKVHWSPVAEASESHVPLGAVSGSSAVELTVKMVAAWAGLVVSCEPNNKSAHIIAAAKAKAVALPIRFVPRSYLINVPRTV